MPPLSALLPRAKLVFDVVYNPAFTRLLQSARQAGCQVISGEEMYLRQARQQFEIFSGLTVSLDELREVWKEILAVAAPN
jgi:3-dehydroquinate dehydratase/shikimate dehydrogenase